MREVIVIVGGGFGGLEAAFSLRGLLRERADIVLIDRGGFHTFLPSIHEIISGKIQAKDIQISLPVILGPAGIRSIQDSVVSLDPGKRHVVMSEGSIGYDYLVLATGAENNFYEVTGAADFSHRFRNAEDAELIHTDLTRLMAVRGQEVNIIIAGGGTEGVEVSGEVVDLIEGEGYGPDLRSGRITVELVHGQSRLLAGFPEEARTFSEEYLAGKGVRISRGDRIVEVRRDMVILESGATRAISILIWTGGIQPSRLIRELQLPKDDRGWLLVDDRLSSPADDRIYGVGDAVSIAAPTGMMGLERLAYHALDQACVAGLNICSAIRGKTRVRYRPKSKPQLVSIGKEMGIMVDRGTFRSGAWVNLAKSVIQTRHLMGYLTRPASVALASLIPGSGLLQRLRFSLPF